MKTWFDPHFRRDLVKGFCLVAALAGVCALFLATPALSTPTLLSVMGAMVFSPMVVSLERKGYPRVLSILILFGTLGLASVLAVFWTMQSTADEWTSFQEKAPAYFDATVAKLRELEAKYKEKYPFLRSTNPTDMVVSWGEQTGKWFVNNGPALMGELLTCLFIAPILTFVMLSDGRGIRQRVFHLVPNRFFESVYFMTHQITTALSDYIRAKLLEALLVGLMVGVGLALVGAPYAVVLGAVAGVTNIIPYLGPFLGAIPGVLIVLLDPSVGPGLFWPVSLVYIVANVIDMVLIFPLVVAKLVNLHPLFLIAVVAVGQQYYGLIGMLISIPIASAVKVVLSELYSAVYEQRSPTAVEPGLGADFPLLRGE